MAVQINVAEINQWLRNKMYDTGQTLRNFRRWPAKVWTVVRHPGQLFEGIEIDAVKKFELAFAAAVVIAIVFLNYQYWWAKPLDMTIASWVEPRSFPVDRTKPVTQTNPRKPCSVTIFANHDGRLEITEWPDDPDKKIIEFVPDTRKTSFILWKDDAARVQKIKDATRRTIMLAGYAYASPNSRRPTILSVAKLTDDQWNKERDARTALGDEMTLLRSNVTDGSFEPALYRKVLDALDAYRANGADPEKDPAKAALAAKVFLAGMAYIEKFEDARRVAVTKYTDVIDQFLDAEQRDAIQKAAVRYAAGRVRPAAKTS